MWCDAWQNIITAPCEHAELHASCRDIGCHHDLLGSCCMQASHSVQTKMAMHIMLLAVPVEVTNENESNSA